MFCQKVAACTMHGGLMKCRLFKRAIIHGVTRPAVKLDMGDYIGKTPAQTDFHMLQHNCSPACQIPHPHVSFVMLPSLRPRSRFTQLPNASINCVACQCRCGRTFPFPQPAIHQRRGAAEKAPSTSRRESKNKYAPITRDEVKEYKASEERNAQLGRRNMVMGFGRENDVGVHGTSQRGRPHMFCK